MLPLSHNAGVLEGRPSKAAAPGTAVHDTMSSRSSGSTVAGGSGNRREVVMQPWQPSLCSYVCFFLLLPLLLQPSQHDCFGAPLYLGPCSVFEVPGTAAQFVVLFLAFTTDEVDKIFRHHSYYVQGLV